MMRYWKNCHKTEALLPQMSRVNVIGGLHVYYRKKRWSYQGNRMCWHYIKHLRCYQRKKPACQPCRFGNYGLMQNIHKEIKNVIVTNITGAFLYADIECCLHMFLEGTIANLILKLEPKLYRNHFWHNRELWAYKFYEESTLWNISSSSISGNCKINWYDLWVANKIINLKQFTIQEAVYPPCPKVVQKK